MISRNFKRYHLPALPALTMLCQLAFAQAPTTHGDSTMRNYQSAGGSPLADVKMHQDINPLAPKMSEAEFDKAKRIFFERCAHALFLQQPMWDLVTKSSADSHSILFQQYLKLFDDH